MVYCPCAIIAVGIEIRSSDLLKRPFDHNDFWDNPIVLYVTMGQLFESHESSDAPTGWADTIPYGPASNLWVGHFREFVVSICGWCVMGVCTCLPIYSRCTMCLWMHTWYKTNKNRVAIRCNVSTVKFQPRFSHNLTINKQSQNHYILMVNAHHTSIARTYPKTSTYYMCERTHTWLWSH